MKPIFCRVGNKYPVRDLILEQFPSNYEEYILPFRVQKNYKNPRKGEIGQFSRDELIITNYEK